MRHGKTASSCNASSPKEIAVKIIRETFTQHFRVAREVEALKRLGEHKNIVQLFDVGKNHKGQTMFYMELCHEDLQEYSKTRSFNDEEVRNFVHQVASGLEKIHSERMVHRDLKPQNILVVYINGRPMFKLTDFGLVHIMRDGEASHLACMSATGSRMFMAPEMLLALMDGKVLTGQPYKVDIFCLGVVICHMITKKVPFKESELISPKFDPSEVLEATILSIPLRRLLKSMLQRLPKGRPYVGAVCRDPFVTGKEEVRLQQFASDAPKLNLYFLFRVKTPK